MGIYSAFDLILVTFSNHWGDLTRPKYVESDLSGFHLSSLLSSLSIYLAQTHTLNTHIQCNPKKHFRKCIKQKSKGFYTWLVLIVLFKLNQITLDTRKYIYPTIFSRFREEHAKSQFVVSLSVELVLEQMWFRIGFILIIFFDNNTNDAFVLVDDELFYNRYIALLLYHIAKWFIEKVNAGFSCPVCA